MLALVTAGVIAVAAGVIVYLRVRTVEHRVWLVNGLDVPVDVNVSGKRVVVVPPQGHVSTTVKVRSSMWFITSGGDGTEVDRQTFTPRNGDGPIVYNVLGAAPLHIENVLYSFSGITIDEGPRGEDIWYRPIVQRGDLDYYFDAPLQIPKPSKPGPVQKRVLRVNGGWKETANWLADKKRIDDAIKIAQTVRSVEPDNSEVASGLERLEQIKNPSLAAPAKSPHDWIVYSAGELARLVQATNDSGACEARCELKTGGFAWSRSTCLASSSDDRFVAPDCSRVVIVRRTMEAPDSIVVSTYGSPNSPNAQDESHPASKFTDSTTRGDWLANPPHLDSNQRSIELETIDHKKHTILLGP